MIIKRNFEDQIGAAASPRTLAHVGRFSACRGEPMLDSKARDRGKRAAEKKKQKKLRRINAGAGKSDSEAPRLHKAHLILKLRGRKLVLL